MNLTRKSHIELLEFCLTTINRFGGKSKQAIKETSPHNDEMPVTTPSESEQSDKFNVSFTLLPTQKEMKDYTYESSSSTLQLITSLYRYFKYRRRLYV